jgi:hypothetical protein
MLGRAVQVFIPSFSNIIITIIIIITQQNTPQAFAKLAAILSRLWFKPAPHRPFGFWLRVLIGPM